MRRGMWILATCGLIGLALGVGNADERVGENPFAFDTPASGPSTSYFSRSGRTSTQEGSTNPFSSQANAPGRAGALPAARDAQPPTRNYYEQLFGSQAPDKNLPTISAGASPRMSDSARPETRSFGANPTEAQRDGVPFDSASNPFDPRARGVIPARYNRAANSPRTGEIQPVRAADSDNPFATASEPPKSEPAAAAPASRQPENAAAAGIPFRRQAETAPPVEVDSTATGPQTPSVTLQWVKKSDITVGQECACDLVVKNSGKVAVRDVNVEAYFPRTIRLTGAEPKPQSATEDHLTWNVPLLEAGAEYVVHVRMLPSQRGELATSAFVRFTGAASGVFNVEEPMLKIALQGPSEVSLGDPASQTVVVSNPGNGVTQNVVIEATIPAGLEHPRGERLIMNVGALNPGDVRQVRLGLIATRGGRHAVQILARADGDLQQQAQAEVNVVAPSIQVAMEGPGLRYVGRSANYVITVSNDGTAVSNNIRVSHRIPEGFQFVSSDRGGQYDALKQTINWFVGRLEPGQSLQLKVDLEAAKLGNHTHTVAAVSEHGAMSEAKFDTTVDGTSSLVLEIVDLDDPVEVGRETGYEVRVKNEGSKAAQNVTLGCELPQGVVLVGAKGPVEYGVAGRQLVFDPLKSLEPGKTALYRLQVRGTVAGAHRFRAQLKSDSTEQPLTYEELTKFYGEE